MEGAQLAAAELLKHRNGGLELALLILFNHGIHDVRLMAGSDLLAKEIKDLVGAFVRDATGHDGCPAGRELVQNTDVEVTIKRQRERARNGGGRHYQRMRLLGGRGSLHGSFVRSGR